MFKQIWKFFLEQVWPLIWPIVRDTLQEVVHELMKWIKNSITEMIGKHANRQQAEAEQEAKAASEKARNATTDEERIRAEAEITAWEKVALKLKSDNEQLKEELAKFMRDADNYAEDRVQIESVRKKTQERFMALPPPSDE